MYEKAKKITPPQEIIITILYFFFYCFLYALKNWNLTISDFYCIIVL